MRNEKWKMVFCSHYEPINLQLVSKTLLVFTGDVNDFTISASTKFHRS